jgi:hypothetical protein
MQAVTQESWRGRTVRIHVFPVRRIDTPDAAPDGYIATVKVVRSGHILADWHLPFFSDRWLSEGEAQRDAFEYAVKLIDSGVLDEPQRLRDRAAWRRHDAVPKDKIFCRTSRILRPGGQALPPPGTSGAEDLVTTARGRGRV